MNEQTKAIEALRGMFGEPMSVNGSTLEWDYRCNLRDPNEESLKLREEIYAKLDLSVDVWACDGVLSITV